MAFFTLNRYRTFYFNWERNNPNIFEKKYKTFKCSLIEGNSIYKLLLEKDGKKYVYFLIPFIPRFSSVNNFNIGIDLIITGILKTHKVSEPFNEFSVELRPITKPRNLEDKIISAIELTKPYLKSAIVREWDLNEIIENNGFWSRFAKRNNYKTLIPSVESFYDSATKINFTKFSDIWRTYGYNYQNRKKLGVTNHTNSEFVEEFVMEQWVKLFSDDSINFRVFKQLSKQKMNSYANDLRNSGISGLIIKPSMESILDELDKAIILDNNCR